MKKQLLAILSAAFITVITFSACSKEGNTPVKYSKEKLVGTYKLTELTTQNGSTSVDLLGQWADCEIDNLHVLNADMTYEKIEAGEPCELASEESGDWSISGNKLVIDGQHLTIELLTAQQLKVAGALSIGGFTTNIKATYTRQ